ncbi:MAG: NUDIX hydrolase [Candidatus Sumerlaeaceae bacterium]|nr:NUDIX hydrolase [Candidatus Sumerlaeaceae bacterium]
MTRGGLERLARALRSHQADMGAEEKHRQLILEFIGRYEHPFDRSIAEGHLTGSALVVEATGGRVLLGYHRKLGRWLQFGGHGEPGDEDAFEVALREATEESGIDGLALYPSAPAPLDVDVHEIPARKGEPAHLHLDIRYLLVAPADAPSPCGRPEEHTEIAWFSWEQAMALEGLDDSLRRLLEKARATVQRRG